MKSIEVVAAVIERDGKILSTQRGYGNYRGSWEFPGGKMEPGETREQALVREIREELDCPISVERPICSVEYDYPEFHLLMHCFLCHLAGDFTLLEHDAATWVDATDIDALDWLAADIEVLDAMKDQGII